MTKKINNSCNIDPDFKIIPFQNGKDLKGVELYILGKKDQQIYLRNLPLSFHDHLLEMYQNSDLCYVYMPIETVLKNLSKEEQEEIENKMIPVKQLLNQLESSYLKNAERFYQNHLLNSNIKPLNQEKLVLWSNDLTHYPLYLINGNTLVEYDGAVKENGILCCKYEDLSSVDQQKHQDDIILLRVPETQNILTKKKTL